MFVRKIAKKVWERIYEYAYLVENQRVEGKIRQRLVLSLGAAESIRTKRIDAVIAALRPLATSSKPWASLSPRPHS